MSTIRERLPKRDLGRPGQAGATLCRLVDLVSHRSGLALATMADAAITLPQVLLLSQLQRRCTASPSDLAGALHVSLPAMSQMIERLVQQGLLDRTEDPVDRRRKSLTTTARGLSLMRNLERARSTDYGAGLAAASPDLLAEMTILLERVALAIEATATGKDQPGSRPLPKKR